MNSSQQRGAESKLNEPDSGVRRARGNNSYHAYQAPSAKCGLGKMGSRAGFGAMIEHTIQRPFKSAVLTAHLCLFE